jgi:predicted PurR-regulated permease PerM
MARWASFIVLLGILLAVAILFLQVMAAFLLPMFLAVLLVVMFRPVHRWILAEMPRYPRLAAGLTTAAILLIVLAPFAWILTQAALEGAALAARFDQKEVEGKLATIRKDVHLHMPYREQLRTIESELAKLEPAEAGARKAADGLTKEQVAAALKPIVASLETIAGSLSNLQELDEETAQNLAKASAQLGAISGRLGLVAPKNGPLEVDLQALPLSGGMLDPQVGLYLVELVDHVEAVANLVQRPTGPEKNEGEPVANLVQPPTGTEKETVDAPQSSPQLPAAVDELQVAYQQRFRTQLLGGPLAAWLKEWTNPTPEKLARLRADLLGQFESWWAPLALGTTQFLGGLVLGLVVMIVSLFFFLADGPGIIQALMRLSPLDERYEQQLVSEFDRVSRAVVVATLLSAFVQGLLAGAGFYLAGLEAVFLLTVLTMFLALIPFVGATAVWLPCSLYVFFYQGRPLAAVLLALYGACVVSVADNVIKPIILHGQSNLHPLLALLSVLGGVRALGPIGIFVGPMAVAFLQALLNIVNMELKNLEERREAGQPPLIPRLGGPAAKPPSPARAS